MTESTVSTNGVHPPSSQTDAPSPPRRGRGSRAERHRTWARDQDILTARGWHEGYVVLRPSRVMGRLFFEGIAPLNSALEHLERNALTLMSGSQRAAFGDHTEQIFTTLATVRTLMHELIRLCERGARGQFDGGRGGDPEASPERLEPGELAAALHEPSLGATGPRHALDH